jgi:hypothetical protein
MCWSMYDERLEAEQRQDEEEAPRFEPEADFEPPEPEPLTEPERELVRA